MLNLHLLFRNYFSLTIFLIMGLSFFDTAFVIPYFSIPEFRSSIYTSIFFFGIVMAYIVAYFFILKFVKNNNLIVKNKSVLKILSYAFYMTCFNFLVIIFQILFFQKYNLFLYHLIIFINYSLSIIIFLFLIRNIFILYKSTKNLFILIYMLSIISFIVTEVLTIYKVAIETMDDPFFITPIRNPWSAYSSSDIIIGNFLYYAYFANFIILWIATVIITKNYSNLIGKLRFILLTLIPLVYFSGPLEVNFFHILDNLRLEDPTLANYINILLFGGIRQIAGTFFAFSFFLLIIKINNERVNITLLLLAMGIILFFSSNQNSILKMVPYPPFGIGLTMFLPLSSLLLYLGFYNIVINSKRDVIKGILSSLLSKNQKKFFQDINSYELGNILEDINTKLKKIPNDFSYLNEKIDINDLTKMIKDILKEKKRKDN